MNDHVMAQQMNEQCDLIDHPALELAATGGGKNRVARAARNPNAHIVRL